MLQIKLLLHAGTRWHNIYMDTGISQYLPTTDNQVGQHSRLKIDESQLTSDHLGDHFKSLVLRYRIEQAIRKNNAYQIVSGVEVIDLQAGSTLVSHEQDGVHFAASINKIPIAWLVLQDLRNGDLNMDMVLEWQPGDVRGGFGKFDQPGAPLRATVGELLFDMLNPSGNTAVRVLVNQGMGGAAVVNTRLAAYSEIPNTRLQPLDANRFFIGNSTAKESLWILRQLTSLQDPPGVFVLNALSTNPFTDISVRSQLAGNEYIVLANKVGLLNDVDGNNRHDIGIIINTRTQKSYAYSLMTTSPFDSETATPRAEQSLKDMGRTLLRFAGDKKQKTASAEGLDTHRDKAVTNRIVY